jgi:hypothetical protein
LIHLIANRLCVFGIQQNLPEFFKGIPRFHLAFQVERGVAEIAKAGVASPLSTFPAPVAASLRIQSAGDWYSITSLGE